MRRVLVVGLCGAGKSTLARAISDSQNLRYIELDALRHGPKWMVREQFVERVDVATAMQGWVADTDAYCEVAALLWSRADTVVWLDLPQSVVLVRVLRRTWRRVRTREALWGGNRETARHVLSRRHPVTKVLLDHGSRRTRISAQLDDFPGTAVRLRTSLEADHWRAHLVSPRPGRGWRC